MAPTGDPGRSAPGPAGPGRAVEDLGSPDVMARRRAAVVLARSVPAPPGAVAGLIRLLKDPDYQTRKNAAFALSKAGGSSPEAVAAFAAALSDEGVQVRREAAHALSRAEAPSEDALAALTRALEDPDRRVREMAAHALARRQRFHTAARAVDEAACYTLEITTRCDFGCVFCLVPPRNGPRAVELSWEELKARTLAVKESGFGRVLISGGEPTLHPRLRELAGFAAGLGLEVVVNTNGARFADAAYLDSFKGISLSCVLSFHAHEEKVFNRLTRTASYRKVLQAARNLLERRIRVCFSHVINKHNYRAFPDWVRFVRENFRTAEPDGTLLVSASVFVNQEAHGPDHALVRFSRVRPFLLKGVETAGFPVEYESACTVPGCLLRPGFLRLKESFSAEARERNLAFLRGVPAAQRRELTKFFIPDKCLSCVKFVAPFCKGIRKNYLLTFGAGEFPGLLTAEERRRVDAGRERFVPGDDERAFPTGLSPAVAALD
ncbi:MAG: HEAT repeat domain-containing protein [Elusimicrobia bacterium]|nr:HEAT repeat domain-containing protein [Elusimicrobiota bacterium]